MNPESRLLSKVYVLRAGVLYLCNFQNLSPYFIDAGGKDGSRQLGDVQIGHGSPEKIGIVTISFVLGDSSDISLDMAGYGVKLGCPMFLHR